MKMALHFAGLLAGSYTIAEGDNAGKGPYVQTYPEEGSYDVSLAHVRIGGINFATICLSRNVILDEQAG